MSAPHRVSGFKKDSTSRSPSLTSFNTASTFIPRTLTRTPQHLCAGLKPCDCRCLLTPEPSGWHETCFDSEQGDVDGSVGVRLRCRRQCPAALYGPPQLV